MLELEHQTKTHSRTRMCFVSLGEQRLLSTIDCFYPNQNSFIIKTMDSVKCETCAGKFLKKKSQILHTKHNYCSSECSQKARKKGLLKPCHICGKIVYKSRKDILRSKTQKFFCSKRCSIKWQNTFFVGDMHPNWRTGESSESYRNILRRRKEMKCVECSMDDKRILVVHHIDKNRRNNAVKNLVWMCPNCHFLTHHYPKTSK